MGDATMVMMLFVVISSILSLRCNAQNLNSCVEAASNPEQTLPNIAECCGILNNAKNAPQLVCDAVIKATNAPSFEIAQSSFDQLAGKCDATVQKKLLFGSTTCSQLPVTSIENECFSFLALPTPTDASTEKCCNALQKQFTGDNGISNEQVVATLCKSLESFLSRFMIQKTANEGFSAIATKCLSNLSIDKSTKCPLPKLPMTSFNMPQ